MRNCGTTQRNKKITVLIASDIEMLSVVKLVRIMIPLRHSRSKQKYTKLKEATMQ